MNILKWLWMEDIADVLETDAKTARDEAEQVLEDAASSAAKAMRAFDNGATAIFTKLTACESQLVDDIDYKTGMLADVRATLANLRSIGVGPVIDKSAGPDAAPVKISPAELQPAPETDPDSTGAAPPAPPVTAS